MPSTPIPPVPPGAAATERSPSVRRRGCSVRRRGAWSGVTDRSVRVGRDIRHGGYIRPARRLVSGVGGTLSSGPRGDVGAGRPVSRGAAGGGVAALGVAVRALQSRQATTDACSVLGETKTSNNTTTVAAGEIWMEGRLWRR